MNQILDTQTRDEIGKQARALDADESRYMQGNDEPVTSSVLISNSKYLNNPYYRDAFVQMALRRHGYDLPETYLVPAMVRAITETKDVGEFVRLIAEEKVKKPEFGAWLDARRLTRYTPESLERYAPETLGGHIRAFIVDSGMNMEFMLQGEVASDLDFMIKRRVRSHDIEHMVTGWGPNQLGEEALAICNTTAVANYFSPELAKHSYDYTVFVSTTSYMRNSLHYPKLMPAYLEAMKLGITAGQALKRPFFMIEWEDYLNETPAQICAELGFERGPGSAWDWSLEASRG